MSAGSSQRPTFSHRCGKRTQRRTVQPSSSALPLRHARDHLQPHEKALFSPSPGVLYFVCLTDACSLLPKVLLAALDQRVHSEAPPTSRAEVQSVADELGADPRSLTIISPALTYARYTCPALAAVSGSGPQLRLPEPLPADTSRMCARPAAAHHSAVPHGRGVAWPATFSHIVGYGASYYSYVYAHCATAALWARVLDKEPLVRKQSTDTRRGPDSAVWC